MDPIKTWDEMKENLKKYLSSSHKDHLLSQLNNLRQGSKSIQDYTKFDDLTSVTKLKRSPDIV